MNPRYFWYRYKYNNARWMNHRIPIDVSLELSSFCNLNCVYCFHDSKTPPFVKQHMSLELIEKTIKDAASIGVNSIKFNYRGEATLNPNFSAACNLAKSLAKGSTFIDRILNTNFNFSNEKRYIFDAMSTLTKVKVSCDSFVPEILEKQRKGCNPSLVYWNLDTFHNWLARKNSGTKIVIQAVRTQLNKDEDFQGPKNRHWPDATLSIRDVVSGRSETGIEALEVKKRYALGRKPCIQANARLIVLANGDVLGCCPDFKAEQVLGNMKDQTLTEIFNGQKAKDLRRALNTGEAFVKEPCKSCPSWESYAGFKASWDS